MNPIPKSSRLDNVCYDIRGPVLDEAKRLETEGYRILKLNIGNPAPFGFHAPDDMVRDMMANVGAADGYSDSRGIYSARTAVINYYKGRGVALDLDRVWIGNGVSEFIAIVMNALLNPGDEVLIPAPDYPLWTASAVLAGGTAVHYRCDEANGWNPDPADIESKVTERTKAIVVINPNNPTGAVYSPAILRQIAEIADRRGLIVFADEIYDRILYDGNVHTHFASISSERQPVFTLSGVSKASFGAGYRAAWMAFTGDPEPIKGFLEGLDMLINMRLCANVIAQHGIQTSLGSTDCIDRQTRPGGRLHVQRDLCVSMLNAIPGVSCVRPSGALYCFPRFDAERFGIEDDKEFIKDFLHEKKVLLVQGTGFNWPENDHARIVFLPDQDTLRDAIERLADFLSEREKKLSRTA